MPAYYAHPSAPTNLTLHEALDINVPIACGDVAVFPGDVLVGDRDGVMVVPAHLADEIADECTGMESYEDFVDIVVPELQARGRYKTAYAPGTLREKLFGEGPQLPERHAGAGLRRATEAA